MAFVCAGFAKRKVGAANIERKVCRARASAVSSKRRTHVEMLVQGNERVRGTDCRFRHRVFVYGTLKRGYPNAHLLENAILEGHYETVKRFPLVVGGEFFSPYLLNVEGDGYNVRGEVYRVDDDMLGKLDELERVGVNYTRKELTVRDEDGEKRRVLAYLKCNYTRELLEAEPHREYKDRRYVPRHMRDKVVQERKILAEKKQSIAVMS